MNFIKKRDLNLDFIYIATLCLGLYSIFSISVNYFQFQLVFALISLGVYLGLGLLGKELISISVWVGYIIMLAILIWLFIFGDPIRGSSSWINIGPFALQPSEFAKISLIYITSWVFSSRLPRIKKYLISATIFLPVFVLTVLQPDVGTAFSILFGVGFILFISVITKKQFFWLLLLSLFLGFVSFNFLQGYQKNRILSFMNPQSDPLGSGYNVIQSKIAIGSGGVFGKGFMQNTQVTLKYLPEPHTDFIFAAVSESFGFLFSTLLIIMLFSMLYHIYKNYIVNPTDKFIKYFASGLFALLFLQIVFNIGMNLGLLPITGLPLPFISYGGSSLLTFSIFLGILQSSNLRNT